MGITHSFISLMTLNIFSYFKTVLHRLRIYLKDNINYFPTPAQKETYYKHCTMIFFFPTKQTNLEDNSLTVYKEYFLFFLVKMLTCFVFFRVSFSCVFLNFCLQVYHKSKLHVWVVVVGGCGICLCAYLTLTAFHLPPPLTQASHSRMRFVTATDGSSWRCSHYIMGRLAQTSSRRFHCFLLPLWMCNLHKPYPSAVFTQPFSTPSWLSPLVPWVVNKQVLYLPYPICPPV